MACPLEGRHTEAHIASGEWWKEEDLPLDLDALLPGGPVTVDVGFGQGEFLLGMAQAEPGGRFVGIDRFREGHRNLLRLCRAGELNNVLSMVGNAFVLLHLAFPDAGLARVTVNFPDPWPKARHAHNRLYQTELFEIVARKLALGGHLYLATDSRPLAEQALAEVAPVSDLRCDHPGLPWLDVSPHPIRTRYEEKWRTEGRDLHYMVFVKR